MSRGARRRALVAGLCCALAAAVAGSAPAPAKPKRLAHSSIIGGGPADPVDWPFVAAVRLRGGPHCGGSVIAPTKILTAGHCVLGYDPADLTVITGRPNLTDASVGQVIPVASTASYPGYGGNSLRYDFGVITLASATTAPAVTLANAGETAAASARGTVLRMAGWGKIHPVKKRDSAVLKEVTQFSAGNHACVDEYGKRGLGAFDPVSMFCVIGQRFRRFRSPETRKRVMGRTSACSGDSGGPLIVDTPSGPRQIGTSSFGPLYCGFRGKPSVYGRVANGLAFINAS